MPQKNLAFEMLEKLLNDRIKVRSRRNASEAGAFAAMLGRATNQYCNRSLESTEIM
jgi:type I restriction enzyme R subunit